VALEDPFLHRVKSGKMTDEELDKIIELLLTDPPAGLKTYGALTMEQRKQVLERAQDERINQIVAEADADTLRTESVLI
jgi:hypothetical protein